MDTFDALAKVVIIGDSSVGKTCLILRYTQDVYRESFLPTIGERPRSNSTAKRSPMVSMAKTLTRKMYIVRRGGLQDSRGGNRIEEVQDTAMGHGRTGALQLPAQRFLPRSKSELCPE